MTFKQFLFLLPFTAFCWLCELTFNLAVDIVQHSPAAQAAVGLLATGLAGGIGALVAYRPAPVPEEYIGDRIAREDAENIVRVAALVEAANQPPAGVTARDSRLETVGGGAPEGVGEGMI